MNDLIKFTETATQVQKKSGVNIVELLKDAPLGNVMVAVNTMSVSQLVKLATGVSPMKLIHGLKIINADQIKTVPFEKLRIVLFDGDMHIVEGLQKRFTTEQIIKALNELSESELSGLLKSNDFEKMTSRICEINGVL